MAKKKTTIEDLAVLVKRGFDQTATKEELRPLATKAELRQLMTKEEFQKGLGELKEQVTRLAFDVAKLKEEMRREDPFVEDLLRRMRVVEKRVGVIK